MEKHWKMFEIVKMFTLQMMKNKKEDSQLNRISNTQLILMLILQLFI